MTATIQLTNASSDLVSFLSSWASGFSSNYGAFYGATPGLVTNPSNGANDYDTWGAGQSGNKGVVIEGSFQYDLNGHDLNGDGDFTDPGEIAPNDLVGTVSSLTLGTGYSQSSSGISLSQQDLVINPDAGNPSAAFDYAIYQFTVNSSIAGLYTYLASVGAVIEDTSASDILTGFAGADTFVLSGGNDTIGAGGTGTYGFQDGADTLDVRDWGAASFGDLTVYASGSDSYVYYGSNSVLLEGIAASDVSAADFLF